MGNDRQEATECRVCKRYMLNTSLHKSCNCVHWTCMTVSFLPQFFFTWGVICHLLFWKQCDKHHNTNYSIGFMSHTSLCTKHVIMSVTYVFFYSYFLHHILRAAIKKTFIFILFSFISTITWHIIPHFICDILFYFHILLPLLKIVALSVIKISGGLIKAN